MTVDLTEQETNVVQDALEQAYRELLLEIARSEHHEFRIALQKRENILKSALEKFGVAQAARR